MTRKELLTQYAAGTRDFSGADLRGVDLSGADLRWANLSRADLRWANLSRANLSRANLREANLREADLREADLSGADLSGADLREADLSGANLREADLSGADLRGADLREADLSRADLREAVGLPQDSTLSQAVADQIEFHPETHNQRTWHSSCGTAHCVAGWAVHKAGLAGKALERAVGTATAAYLLGIPTTVDFGADADKAANLAALRGAK